MIPLRCFVSIFLIAGLVTACTPSQSHPTPAVSTPALVAPAATSSIPTWTPSSYLSTAILPTPSSTALPPWENPALASTLGPTLPAATDTVIQRAIADLASRLGLSTSAVQVVRVSSADFPSGNLGCPASGTPSLPQPAFVTGKEVLLQAGAGQFLYHTHGGQVIFCGEMPQIP